MNEVKTVHLGRQQFTIAVDAYKELQEYLHAIQKQPGVQSEVVKEVEMRMAELLLERGVSDQKVILPEDVDFLKEQLGEPRDFTDDEAVENETEKTAKHDKSAEADAPKRLYRDTQNGLIAGVASGLAAYTGIDVLLIRILFVVLAFASGAGILLYILIWLLAPDAKTPSERLQMRGKAVTVDSLKEVIDRADIPGAGKRAGRAAGQGVAAVAENIAKALLAVVGVGFILAGVSAMLSAIAATAYMLIHGARLGAETMFPRAGTEVWFVALAGVALLLFGFLLFMIGMAMVARKWRLPGWLVAAVLGIFLVAGGVGTALGFDIYPQLRQRYKDSQHTVTRQLQPFTSVSLDGEDTNYEFVADTSYFVEVNYLGNLDIKHLATDIRDNNLTIDTKKMLDEGCPGVCLYDYRDVKVVVHAPKLDKVSIAGIDNSFHVYEPLQQDALVLEADDINDNKLIVNHAQAAEAKLSSDGSGRTLALHGLKADAPFDAVVQLTEYSTIISRTDAFELTTPDRCEADEPLVYLRDAPDETVVNGRSFKGRQALLNDRNDDRRSDSNCVIIR